MVADIVQAVLTLRRSVPQSQSILVGLSGIDGSGKGYVASQLVRELTVNGLKSAAINVDGWLNLPNVRFDLARPAENFYERGLRLEDLFSQLIVPLREHLSARVTMELVEETATATRPFTYDFNNIDIIVLEGIFLFKRAHREHFDLAVWIDCSWDTALERALARAQEGLPPEATIRAYRTIYFPAQERHFTLDSPRQSADLILPNDPQLSNRSPAGLQPSNHVDN